MEKGYVQVYTGNGKGKTTCSLGLVLRACGARKRVYIGQFMKGDDYSEIKAIREFLPQVTLEQYGNENFVTYANLSEQEINEAKLGFNKAMAAIKSGEYDVVVLDEINVAVFMELVSEEEALSLIDARHEHCELIMTGRYASEKIKERADLVTEMKEIKHYFTQGVMAREGIEK